MTVKNGKFDICTECGAHLDPGENATARKNISSRGSPQR